MLYLLQIENIAVIEQAQICFDKGFNVLTGETGAGKSIVIDAISAILGQRAYRDVIRTGSSKAYVSAVFRQIPPLHWFAENGVPYDPEELLVQREIFADGKNVCKVNGRIVTVALLKQLGSSLVNIHGQHDSQQLFDETTHLSYLDLFAQNHIEYDRYRECYERVVDLRTEIDRLTMNEAEKIRKVEMLRYQIEEIDRAELKPGEDAALESRRKILQNAEKLADGLNSAYAALYGTDDGDGAASLLDESWRAVSRIASYDDNLDNLSETLKELSYQVQDAAEELRDYLDGISYSADELEQIESRLDIIHRLRKKYGVDVDAVLAYAEHARQELDEIEFSEERIEKLSARLKEFESEAVCAAAALRKTRVSAAEKLENRLSEELAALDMPKARFVCQFEEKKLDRDGMDSVRFLMTANVGESLKPMSKVASGGELARIMLAIKNVLAEQESIDTMIFDEVDAGVSGRAAHKVGLKLKSVSRDKQVLCVTHLPQIAAMADHHLLISKSEHNGRTFTSVEPLDEEGRTVEIARIIGGANITQTTLQSAKEMLSC